MDIFWLLLIWGLVHGWHAEKRSAQKLKAEEQELYNSFDKIEYNGVNEKEKSTNLSLEEQLKRRNLRWERRDNRRKKDPYFRKSGFYSDSMWYESSSDEAIDKAFAISMTGFFEEDEEDWS